MRLLITDGKRDFFRTAVVTGLGKGVDTSGRLGEAEMAATLDVFEDFGRIMDSHDVRQRRAIATSASRDAANGQAFVVRAAELLGVEPEVVTGQVEGRLAFGGATSDLAEDVAWTVSDIGGGSTEFASRNDTLSIDIGSVRLTDRILQSRPFEAGQAEKAHSHVAGLFADIGPFTKNLVGVAGTWTSLAAMDLGLSEYRSDLVHHHVLPIEVVESISRELGALTIPETIERFGALDPKRAPVIAAGAVVAVEVLRSVGGTKVIVSERDTLDGVAMGLLALA